MKQLLPRLLTLAAGTFLATSALDAQCSASFTWTQPSNNVINFTSTSTPFTMGSTYFNWNFGDSQSAWSFTQTTSHTYALPGVYAVCLTMYDSLSNCQDIYCDSVVVTGVTSIEEHSQAQWTLFPNPAENEIRISSSEMLQGKQYRILDVTGRVIESGTLTGTQLNVAGLQNGMYILQIENDKGRFANQRFMKN
jgi:PKD repeat protein